MHLITERPCSRSIHHRKHGLTIVSITGTDTGKRYFGLGLGENIVLGATQAMISSINRMLDDLP